jgi:hypothetical protein
LLLFVDGAAVGVIEAKPEGATLTGVLLSAVAYAALVKEAGRLRPAA